MTAAPSMEHQGVGPSRPILFRHPSRQIALDLFGAIALGKSQPSGQAAEMRVHDQPRFPEHLGPKQMRRFASDARQPHEGVEIFRNLPFVFAEEGLRQEVNGARLVPEETGGADFVFQRRQGYGGPIGGGAVFLEQGGGQFIHPAVRALCREDRGNRQFHRRGPIQLATSIRIGLPQNL